MSRKVRECLWSFPPSAARRSYARLRRRPLCHVHGGAKGSGKQSAAGLKRIAEANTKHGHYTAEAVEERRELRETRTALGIRTRSWRPGRDVSQQPRGSDGKFRR